MRFASRYEFCMQRAKVKFKPEMASVRLKVFDFVSRMTSVDNFEISLNKFVLSAALTPAAFRLFRLEIDCINLGRLIDFFL